jgi:uncharacterized protein YkwD
MLCLFFLKKTNADEKLRLFFENIGKGGYGEVDSQDVINVSSTTSSQSTTTVKSFIKEVSLEKPKNIAKISIGGIIYYTNIERKKVGLSPLSKNTKLTSSAAEKTDDMFTKQYFEHTAPDGKTAADLVKSFDYKFQIV